MGMGEPLANYDATVAAVRALIDPDRFGISARSVTVSTIGLPKAICRLAREGLPITLAVSLHAPNEALRRRLLPNAPAPLDAVLDAARAFYQARHREVTLEYVLLAGVNDTPLCADGLAKLANSLRCNVNVIRYNPVSPQGYARPSQAATEAFAARLKRRGVNVHVRRSRGLEADAACGQLRARRGAETG
jgi:23S rRNA (adenine2503-C2)-methyltransferase